MASSFTVINGNTKIDFNYTAVTAVIQNIIGNAAEYLWNHGYGNHGTEETPILFSSLTNNQKLSLVEDHVKKVVIDCANTNKSIKAQDLAREAEEESKYSL